MSKGSSALSDGSFGWYPRCGSWRAGSVAGSSQNIRWHPPTFVLLQPYLPRVSKLLVSKSFRLLRRRTSVDRLAATHQETPSLATCPKTVPPYSSRRQHLHHSNRYVRISCRLSAGPMARRRGPEGASLTSRHGVQGRAQLMQLWALKRRRQGKKRGAVLQPDGSRMVSDLCKQ